MDNNSFVSYGSSQSPSANTGGTTPISSSNVTMIEKEIPRFYHRTTTNKSFLEMSNYLKAIGIKNYRFMLTLLDPDLANIDPYDPNLTTTQKLKVLVEIRNNMWYFMREVVRVPSSGGPVKFILNRGNMAFLYLASMNINVVLLQSRQTGKTIGAACWYVYVYNFRTQNTQISLLNKERRDAMDNLERIRNIRDLLPSYLRFDAKFSVVNGKKKQVASNTTFMENAFNNNKFKTYAKARNEINAANLLRGQTFPLLWCDEFAFIPFMETIYGNMAPAMSTASAIAKKNNVPYGIVCTTTPGFLTTDEGKYAYEVVNNATKFTEGWYDLAYPQIRDIIDSNYSSTFVHIQFSYQELGYSEKWFTERVKEQNQKWDMIRREYLLEWSDESEKCPFTKDELEVVKRFTKPPKKTILIFNKYEFNIFEEIPLRSNNVPKYVPIIGVDPSGGVSKDFSCITVIDSKTTKVIAELRSNAISLIDLARVLEYLVVNFMPNAVINIERNGGYGHSVISKLKETRCKRNLYFEIREKVLEETTDGTKIIRNKRKTKVFGLYSDKYVRERLIDLLKERMNFHKDKFISPTIYNELRGLEVKNNGKVEHSELTHDDQIFSYLMALYVWYEGKNLKETFGIEKFGIKTEDDIDDVLQLDGTEEYGDITQDILYLTKDDNDKLSKDMKEMQRAKGIMFKDFVEKQRKYEQQSLKNLLSNPANRQAYANRYGIPVDTVSFDDGTYYGPGGLNGLPDSVFTDFNKDYSEMRPGSVYYNLNDQNVINNNSEDNGLQ